MLICVYFDYFSVQLHLFPHPPTLFFLFILFAYSLQKLAKVALYVYLYIGFQLAKLLEQLCIIYLCLFMFTVFFYFLLFFICTQPAKQLEQLCMFTCAFSFSYCSLQLQFFFMYTFSLQKILFLLDYSFRMFICVYYYTCSWCGF